MLVTSKPKPATAGRARDQAARWPGWWPASGWPCSCGAVMCVQGEVGELQCSEFLTGPSLAAELGSYRCTPVPVPTAAEPQRPGISLACRSSGKLDWPTTD